MTDLGLECVAFPMLVMGLFMAARGLIDLWYGRRFPFPRHTRPLWLSFILFVVGLAAVFNSVVMWMASNPGR